MKSYISIDLETTGLSPKYDKIIEIGAAMVEGGEVTKTFETFVNPGRRLDERVVDLTGITEDALKNAESIEIVLPRLLEFIGDLPLLGHRILFDYSFIKHAAVNQKLKFEKEGVDTLKISRVCFRELPSKRLTDMCAHYGIEYDAHRALNDALATVELYNCLKRDFIDREPTVFVPEKLVYQVKKESPIRPSQIDMINALIARFHIDCPYEVSKMTRNEASRYYDQMCAKYGVRK